MKFLYALILSATVSISSFSQQATLPKGYYVIVGAFAVKNNAERYNATLQQKEIQSQYAFIPSRNLYYVFTLSDQSASKCLQEARELRKQPQFNDAWVRFLDENAQVDEPVEEIEQPVKAEEKTAPVTVVETEAEPQAETIPVTDNEPIVQ